MSTTTNYTTRNTYTNQPVVRKVDLYVQGPYDFGLQQGQALLPSLSANTGGKVCAGLVKLAQKALNTLLNYDVFYDSSWGTALTSTVINNPEAVRRDFGSLLNSLLESVVDQLKAQETDDDPDDERIRVFNLIRWERIPEGIYVTLQVVSMINESTEIVVPIPMVP